MGYGNRPTMPNNGYQKGSFNKNYNQKKSGFNSNYNSKQQGGKPGFNTGFNKSNPNTNRSSDNSFKNNNNSTFKSDDDIYTPKIYAKKPKEKSMFDDIIIPEYLEDRQRMRNKRANDKKYKDKNRRDYWGE